VTEIDSSQFNFFNQNNVRKMYKILINFKTISLNTKAAWKTLTNTVFWYLIHTFLVGIAMTILALHALLDNSLQKFPAEVTDSGAHVAMENECVGDPYTSRCFSVCCAPTQRRRTALPWYNITRKEL
jgi:hypothetical protein